MRKRKEKTFKKRRNFSCSLSLSFLTCRQVLASGAPFLSALYPDPLRDTKPPPPEEEEESEASEAAAAAGEEADDEDGDDDDDGDDSPSFLRAASKASRSSASSLWGTLRLPVPFLALEEGPPLEMESTSA